MEQQRGLLLLFLGLQLLLMGALLYQNHHRHSLALFLRVLRRDRPVVGEELPFLVSVSSAGTSSQDVYANLSEIHPVDRRKEDLPSCPLISPYINGPLRVMIPENLTMEQVVKKNPLVELGGQYQPPDCWTRHHTAVVVPYYGRDQHLQHLLFHLHPFLQLQQLHYAIYVVNQVHNTAFNRGKLRNVGFWEAMQEEEWDCLFFHDVNLLPEDDRNLYICDIFPAHVSVAIDKFDYKLPYRGYLGGVFALRPIHYLKINGFPNSYQGWDLEDHDIAARWEALLKEPSTGLQVPPWCGRHRPLSPEGLSVAWVPCQRQASGLPALSPCKAATERDVSLLTPSALWPLPHAGGAGPQPPAEPPEPRPPGLNPPQRGAGWHQLVGLQAAFQGAAGPLHQPHCGHRVPHSRVLGAPVASCGGAGGWTRIPKTSAAGQPSQLVSY
ncbi:beta-1,4-galactosyltransferase 2 isoform X1 [Mustela putorius furo]|uniref:Beta-1,4-galactosyltransferase n=3 Tax=Mustela putorius furo TaxID=9669 RepID=A0A8U0N4M1_MUSPF|nr:beta-1,4-galactosyltransferase 2 isoform X1 [Mustela putorius furo]XP_004767161.1 beta-1,4-galactosyltransferase 2 isoform X1 [Mustela putorius furo]XP_004767163.1 beta-1,4-galactosyltransferase 2 isoform X1 [Mustela putorius furo]XP_044933347.1 beta-1,4-galactosyltransferase 2 isoform X1 [Mustela putorius furo]